MARARWWWNARPWAWSMITLAEEERRERRFWAKLPNNSGGKERNVIGDDQARKREKKRKRKAQQTKKTHRKETENEQERSSRWSKVSWFCSCGWRFWCWVMIWLEMSWSSSLGKPARVYKWINWSRPCRMRNSGNAPLTTMWHRERKPLNNTLGGDAEKGERTWETLVGPW